MAAVQPPWLGLAWVRVLYITAVGKRTTISPGLPGPYAKTARSAQQGRIKDLCGSRTGKKAAIGRVYWYPRAQSEHVQRCVATDSDVRVVANQTRSKKSSTSKLDDVWKLREATIKPHNLRFLRNAVVHLPLPY